MESREMLLKNLSAGKQWRNRYREQTYGHGEKGAEDEMYGKSNMETYMTIGKIVSQWEFVVEIPQQYGFHRNRAQETQPGALYQPRGVEWGGRSEGGSKGRGYMYTYG